MDKRRVEVLPEALACPLVELDKAAMLKTGKFKPLGKSAASAEKFKAPHLSPIM